jgi:hypothetical protein
MKKTQDLIRYDSSKTFDSFATIGIYSLRDRGQDDFLPEEVAYGSSISLPTEIDQLITGEYFGKMIRAKADFMALNRTLVQMLERNVRCPKVVINSTLCANFARGLWQIKSERIIELAEMTKQLMLEFDMVGLDYKAANDHCELYQCYNHARGLIRQNRAT